MKGADVADKKTETAFQPSLSWRACVALIAAVTTLALDYVTKVFVKNTLMVTGESVSVIPGIMSFRFVANKEMCIRDSLNAVAARDLTRSLELLKLQPAKSEVRIWSLLVTRLRELIIAKSLDARGQAGQLASALGVQTWQVKNHASWARRWKMDELLEALSSAVDVELALKGSRDGELALQMWVMGMCRPQQRRGR